MLRPQARRFLLPLAAMLAPLPLAGPALAGPAAGASVNAELASAVAALRSISTMRADFTQIDSNGGRVAGVMTLKRGGKIRFQYAPGYPMLVISDGAALTVVDTELNKLQRWPIGDSPLGALLDPSRDVSRYGRVLPGDDPNIVSVEVHDRAHPEYGTLTLIFARKAGAPGGLELTAWASLDAQNRRTFVRLANNRYGVPVDDALFRYRNPLAGPHH